MFVTHTLWWFMFALKVPYLLTIVMGLLFLLVQYSNCYSLNNNGN